MTRKHLATASWIVLPAAAFALGWGLKPAPDSPGPDSSPSATIPAGNASAEVFSGSSRIRKSAPSASETGSIGPSAPASALTRDRIRQLGTAFRSSLDPIERRETFAALIQGLTVENAKEIREQIAHLPANSAEFRDFHYAWGKIGGVDAILHGADTEKPDMVATLAGWASADPSKAVDWFQGLEAKGSDDPEERSFANRDYLKWGMIHGLANTNPRMAAEFVVDLAAGGEKSAEHMLGSVTLKLIQSEGAEEAAAWLESLPAGKLRASAAGRVAHEYARVDPVSASRWAAAHAGDEHGGHVVGAVSREWARQDGAATVKWLDSLDNSPPHAYHAAFEGWAGKDPSAASQHIVGMPASSHRDSAISGLVNRHRWEDPVAALTWADQIANEERRQASLVAAAQAYYRKDREAASEWLPNSGLTPAQQRRVMHGDRR